MSKEMTFSESECPMKQARPSNTRKSQAGGCPIISAQKNTDAPEGGKAIGGSAEQEFLNYSAKQTKDLFDGLRRQTEVIEDQIAEGEREVLLKDDIAFLMRRHELELSNLINSQTVDYQKRKEQLAAILTARSERKKAKKEARNSIRSSKKRDVIILQQEITANTSIRDRETVAEKRAAFDHLTQHMYEIHDKQRKNLIQAQERRFQNEKLMVDLETRHLKEEIRLNLMKKFQVRQNHQGHLNKKVNDNLREVQLMELRHSKERFELEMVTLEDVGNKRILHESLVNNMKLRHMTELHAEKENVNSKHEQEKDEFLKATHRKELKRLQYEHRIALRQLRIKQDQTIEAKKCRGGAKRTSKEGSKANSTANSAMASMLGSRAGSNESLESGISSNSQSKKLNPQKMSNAISNSMEIEEEGEGFDDDVMNSKFAASLKALINRHKDELNALEGTCKQEINDLQLALDARLQEMEENQNQAITKLLEDQEREIEILKNTQEKEIKMEESIHDSEMKMLVERRILNSVLETVADGIINITPTGVIKRFNHAAEIMFGYSASEVIDQNITMLMPERFSINHHEYLNNYLTTGVKKVIGIGRRVFGLRKNGQEFPLHLSVSELKEDGEHLFTGIARDMSEEVAEENKNLAKDKEKQKELERLANELDAAKKKANGLLSQMLPKSVSKQLLEGQHVKAQSFDCASVCFIDVVGFSSITTQIQPLDTVNFLNELYQTIDHIIEKYDVYKVETVGDTYMVAAGVPKPNLTHAAEIATMSIHLLAAIEKFVFTAKPDIKVKVRIGINSGPLVAGVIGSKMPRYCLFGDTVNTASRMESNGQANKIHVSEATYNLLKKNGTFGLTGRGEIEIKGKGKMTTFWVDSKLNFDPIKLLEAESQ